MEWVGVEEAATRTGASKEALRKRAQRGANFTRKRTLPDGKERWEFLVPHDAQPVQDSPARVQDTQDTEAMRFVLSIQREHIRDLQQQIAVKDAQIEGLMSRVPELEAPPEGRPWWRRLLGN